MQSFDAHAHRKLLAHSRNVLRRGCREACRRGDLHCGDAASTSDTALAPAGRRDVLRAVADLPERPEMQDRTRRSARRSAARIEAAHLPADSNSKHAASCWRRPPEPHSPPYPRQAMSRMPVREYARCPARRDAGTRALRPACRRPSRVVPVMPSLRPSVSRPGRRGNRTATRTTGSPSISSYNRRNTPKIRLCLSDSPRARGRIRSTSAAP